MNCECGNSILGIAVLATSYYMGEYSQLDLWEPFSKWKTGMNEPLYYARIERKANEAVNLATVRDVHKMKADEPTWSDRGNDNAPCPVDYLLVAVGGCQVETLCYCIERSRVEVYELNAIIEAEYDEAVNEETGIPNPMTNTLTTIKIAIEVSTPLEYERQVRQCLDHSERHGCIVSRSIEPAIDVCFAGSVRGYAEDANSPE